MAGGTFATYQGFPLRACRFVRERGFSTSTSVVDIMASVLPAGWSVEAPDLSALFTREHAAPSDGKRIATGFSAAGKLVMRYVDERGVDYQVAVEPLYVIRAETIRHAVGVERVRLTLADVRYFYVRGLLERWSFNRVRADGTTSVDSIMSADDAQQLGAGGGLFTRALLARWIAKRLPGSPDLVGTPDSWAFDRGPVELQPPMPLALVGLQQLVAKAGLEDPCLRLDGKLGLHAAGDGMLGYAPGGKGPNTQAFDRKFMLYKDGQGQGRVVEPGYPEEFVVVVGGERVASVALDDWEPVLVLPGHVVVVLSEEVVRKLTDDRYGLDWLKKFVLRPPALRNDPFLDPAVTDLLGDQAWRLWRMPGVEVGPEEERRPGPNAHLLPMQPRAETEGGRRIAPTVEIFHFTTEHVLLRGAAANERVAAIRKEIAQRRENLPVVAASVGPSTALGLWFLTPADLAAIRRQGVPPEELDAAIRLVRSTDALRDGTFPGSSNRNPDALSPAATADKLLQLQRDLAVEHGNGREAVFDAALEVVKAERALASQRSFGDRMGDVLANALDPGPRAKAVERLLKDRDAYRAAVAARVLDQVGKAGNARAQAKQLQAAGVETAEAPQATVTYSNRPKAVAGGPVPTRQVDVDAIVWDEQNGIVRTSELPGHVKPDGAPAVGPGSATFVPRPVRVVFGATLQPRIDVAPQSVREGRVRTGESAAGVIGGGQNVVPAVLDDEAGRYHVAFRRAARGTPVRVKLTAEVRARAGRIDDPDLVELVGLDGRSNAGDLDQRAANLAAERFNAPDMVESQRVLLAHPWPVNCDGVVESVTITMRERDNAPCGFETLVTTGSSKAAVKPQDATRTRTAAQLAAAKGAAAKRGGLSL